MKKIMFNDRYGLTDAVLSGRKTQTRRVARLPDKSLTRGDLWNPTMGIDERGKVHFTFDCIDGKQRDLYPQYQPGEVLAVAQTYNSIVNSIPGTHPVWAKIIADTDNNCPGYHNKMFVRADLMLHRIRITDIAIEPLQDITDEDIIKEGIEWHHKLGMYGIAENVGGEYIKYPIIERTPRKAFASLIDRISGRGTWQRNPWVWVYHFERIK